MSERSESKGGSNSVVESQPSKLLVAGSIPVSRSSLRSRELSPARELRLGEPNAVALSLPRCDVGQRERQGREEPVSPKRIGDAGARRRADVAQLAERVLGKDEVTSSILVIGSNLRSQQGNDRELRLAGQ